MDRTSAPSQVKPSFLRSISLKFGPHGSDWTVNDVRRTDSDLGKKYTKNA
jgi:hypothetical protein